MQIVKSLIAAALMAVTTSAAFAQDRDIAREEANRALVLEFYDTVFNQHDVAKGAAVLVEDYKQHNPNVPNGKAPFVGYFTDFFAKNPQARSRIVRSSTDGDLVWLHVHSTNGPDDLGRAVVDILRVEDGKITEHWDVIQPVPETSANDNTMF
ncbi:MAG TPA: nuclear transport factor 2 family protein [Paenirhodobacter sp.]